MLRTAQSLVRVTAFAALLLVLVAIGLGRLSPGPEGRTIRPGYLVGVATRYPGADAPRLQLLDVRDTTLRSMELDPDERIDLATGSPWVDGWEQAHVVGRWKEMEPGGTLKDTGLARVAFPSGRVLERVSLTHYPVAPPCWVAGTSARILFVSGDGNLYRYDFEANAGSTRPAGEAGLTQVRWAVDPPGDRGSMLIDVVRPDGVLPPDLVLVTLLPRNLERKRTGLDETQIWWLRLGPDEQEIIACGPVISADPRGIDVGRRRPVLGRRADGSFWLAYLSWNDQPHRMLLRIAPARIDDRTGAPVVDSPAGLVLADDCLSATPAFTDGGSRLTFLAAAPADDSPTAIRIALADAPSPTALAVSGIPPGL